MKRAALLLLLTLVLSGRGAVPDAKWLKQIGASNDDYATSIAVDRVGNVYVTGSISGTNVMFDNQLAAVSKGETMYVAKFDRHGSNVWVVTSSGGGSVQGRGVAVDEAGNVYVAGTFYRAATNTFGNTNIVSSSADLFLAKYDSYGNFLWIRQGQGSIQLGTSLTIAGDRLYVAGQCRQFVDFGTLRLTNAALFLATYDLDGNVVAARSLGAPVINNGFVYQVAVSTNGDYYVGLNFDSPTISFGGTNVSRAGQYADALLVKWNALGVMQWFQHLRGRYVTCDGVSLAPNSDVVIVGRARGDGTVAGQAVDDSFLARFASDGSLRWVKNVSTNGTTESVRVDGRGDSFVCGSLSPGISRLNGTIVTNVSTQWSPFVARFDEAGNLVWYLCSNLATNGQGYYTEGYFHSIALDASGAAYLSGIGNSSSTMLGTKTATGAGRWDILMARLTPEPPPLRISKLGNAVTLSWPTNQHGFILEQASEPGTVWTPVANPVGQEGANFVTTNSTVSPSRFFRLREE